MAGLGDILNILRSVPTRRSDHTPFPLHPFDAALNHPVPLPGGSFATEYSATSQAPDGSWLVHPQIWWNPRGEPVYLAGERGLNTALAYERQGGNPFQRFASPQEADAFAAQRSNAGGGLSGPQGGNALAQMMRRP